MSGKKVCDSPVMLVTRVLALSPFPILQSSIMQYVSMLKSGLKSYVMIVLHFLPLKQMLLVNQRMYYSIFVYMYCYSCQVVGESNT